jgi:hypothetical protein
MTHTADRPFVRPGFLKWATVVFLLLLPFVIHAVWDFVDARRLNARIDAIVRSGAPVTTRHVWDLPPDDAKGESYYRAAAALAGSVPPAKDVRVEDYAEALSFVDRAADLPFSGFIERTDQYTFSRLARVKRALEARGLAQAAAGDADAAFRSLYVAARMARTHDWAFVPSLEFVKTVAERVRPSRDVRDRAERAFAEIDRSDRARRFTENNRALLLEDLTLQQHRIPRIDDWVWRPWMTHLAVRRLDEYAALLAGRTPSSSDATSVVGMYHQLERRVATIHCEHQLVAGEVVNCSP